MGIYKVGDGYHTTYPDAPRPPERQYKIGQRVSVREGGALVLIYKVTATDDTHIRGEIVQVFRGKVPTDPRRGGPAANREVKPL